MSSTGRKLTSSWTSPSSAAKARVTKGACPSASKRKTDPAAAETDPKPIYRAPLRLERTTGGRPWPTDTKPEAWNQLARVSVTNGSADRQGALESQHTFPF